MAREGGPDSELRRLLVAYLADQGPTSHPIRQPIADVAQAAASVSRTDRAMD